MADFCDTYLPAARLTRDIHLQVDSKTRLGSNSVTCPCIPERNKTIEALPMPILVHHRHGHNSGRGPSQTLLSTYTLESFEDMRSRRQTAKRIKFEVVARCWSLQTRQCHSPRWSDASSVMPKNKRKQKPCSPSPSRGRQAHSSWGQSLQATAAQFTSNSAAHHAESGDDLTCGLRRRKTEQ